jgi:hypothetical protein
MEASVKEFKLSAQRPLESGGLAQVDPLKRRQQWIQGQKGREMPQIMTEAPDCEVERADDNAEARLPMQARVAVIATTTLMLWGGFIAGLRALAPHMMT